jgi:AraC family transcriptional regulator
MQSKINSHRIGIDTPLNWSPIRTTPPLSEHKVKQWGSTRVETYTQGAGESFIRVPEFRLTLVRSPSLDAELRINGAAAQIVQLERNTVLFFPPGMSCRAVAGSVQLTNVFHDYRIYEYAVRDLANISSIKFDWIRDLADPQVVQLINMLALEAKEQGVADPLLVESLSNALAVHVIRHFMGRVTDETPHPGGLERMKLRQVRDYIDAHLGDKSLSLEELAAVSSLSTYQFGRSFRRATGTTPHQFVLRSRVDRAQHLLRTTDRPLWEIGSSVGFGDQAHFATRFRQFTGVTPRQFRQSLC